MVRRSKWLAAAGLILIISVLAGCHGGEHGSDRDSASTDKTDSTEQIDTHRLQLLKQLDETADLMYTEVVNGDIAQAREHMKRLGEQVTEIEFSGIATVEGAEALMTAIVNAKELLNAVQTEPERLQVAASQVRLSTDALVNKNHPLWLQYYKTMKEDTNQLRKSLTEGHNIIMAAQQLHVHYSVIRPAVLISRPPEMNAKIDSLIAFFMQQTGHSRAQPLDTVQQLDRAWDELFGKDNVSAYLPVIDGQQPIYWSFVIGSIIITVLGFVAWRKYQSEQGYVTVNGRYKDYD